MPDQGLVAELHELLRHLPPSGEHLRLMTIGDRLAGKSADLLAVRPDLTIRHLEDSGHAVNSLAAIAESAADAIIINDGYARLTEPDRDVLLRETCRILRPGGRLILLDRSRWPGSIVTPTPEMTARSIEAAGFVRVLGEQLPNRNAILARGEKPYPVLRATLAPDHAAPTTFRPISGSQIAELSSPFVFLLIRQTPNLPVWSIPPDTPIHWEAATVHHRGQPDLPIVLAFSALPKAVTFMQPAVTATNTANNLIGVTRIAKFTRSRAAQWTFPLLINPAYPVLHADSTYEPGGWLPIDPQDAVTGDE